MGQMPVFHKRLASYGGAPPHCWRGNAACLLSVALGMVPIAWAAEPAHTVVAQAPGSAGAPVAPVPATPAVQQAPAAAPVAASSGGPKFEIRKFEVEGATLIGPDRIAAAVRPFSGPEREFADVQRALEALERLFVDDGFGSVQVLLPEQELEQGTVRFKVIEPRIGKVLVEGNQAYSEANIRASLPALKEGQAPNSNAIAANLRLANENPGKGTTVLLRAGASDTEVDAVVRVVEDRLTRWNVGVDNTGGGNTGSFRFSAGMQTVNVLGRDHVFAAQVVTSPDERNHFRGYSRDVAILGLQYRIPVYAAGDMLDFTAGYSNVNSGVVQNIYSVSGRGTVFGVRYTQNLRKLGDVEHRLIYSWDFRQYDNSVTPVGGGQQIVPGITVRPLGLTYSGSYRTQSAETSMYLSYNRNLPGSGRGGSSAFDFSRGSLGTGLVPTARPGYTVWRYGFTHYRSFANDWQVRASLSGQFTRDMLVAGEQYGLGGATSVRGFGERQFANDYGVVANFELYTPELSQAMKLGDRAKLRLVFFHDTGHLVRNEPQPADTARLSASGSGAGVRVTVGSNLSFRLDAAFANLPSNTGNTQLPVSLKQFRMHGALVYVF